MTWKIVNISNPGTSIKFGADDTDKISKLFSGQDVDDVDINADWKFRSGKLQLANPANTFKYIITPDAIVADRTLNVPLLTGTDTLVVLSLAQTITNKTLDGTNNISGALAGSSVAFTNAANAFGDFDNSFKDNRVRIWNPADTFRYTIVAAAIAADRTLNLPLITSTDTLVSLGLSQTFTAAKTFNSSTLKLRNPADTFSYTIVPAAIAADRNLNLPLTTGTDTLASLGIAQTFTGVNTFDDYSDRKAISAPGSASAGYVRIYPKTIDSNNEGLFVKEKVNGAVVEVQYA